MLTLTAIPNLTLATDECEKAGGEKVCVKPDEVVVKVADLLKARDQMLVLQAELAAAYAVLDEKDALLHEKDVEIITLEQKNIAWSSKYDRDTRGMWVGAATGIPFGVMGTFGYQFNERFQVDSSIGYMGQFQWQAGFSTRIGR